jgi:hypothetical protein
MFMPTNVCTLRESNPDFLRSRRVFPLLRQVGRQFCMKTSASSGRNNFFYWIRYSIATIDAIEHVLNVANSYLALWFYYPFGDKSKSISLTFNKREVIQNRKTRIKLLCLILFRTFFLYILFWIKSLFRTWHTHIHI